ncbi:MAG: preprotein translocase subunit SecG [bacterium]
MFSNFFVGVATVIHVLVSIILIAVVLLQSQQSMNLSGLMGGASQSAMGSQSQSVLSKVTTVLAIAFFITSLFFALYRNDTVLESPSGTQQAPTGPPAQQETNGEPGEAPAEQAPGGAEQQQPAPGDGEQAPGDPSEAPQPTPQP